MSRRAIISRPLSLGAAVAALFAGAPAVAVAATKPPPTKVARTGATTVNVPTCNAPALAKVYSWAQDGNWYNPKRVETPGCGPAAPP